MSKVLDNLAISIVAVCLLVLVGGFIYITYDLMNWLAVPFFGALIGIGWAFQRVDTLSQEETTDEQGQ